MVYGRKYEVHRLIWLYMIGEWPKDQVDHRDTDKTNNRWSNLREATVAQNSHNVSKRSRNKSGYKGVSKHTQTGRWEAKIAVSGKHKYLGLFANKEDAVAAYAAAASQMHGEFARHS